jgi:hypothetical protein
MTCSHSRGVCAACGARRAWRWISPTLLAALAGCTGAPISDLGGGRHHLAVRAQHGAEGLDLDRANALHLAEDYCRKSGQRAKIEGFDQEGPFKASNAVGVVFRCEQPSHEEMPHHNPG